MVVIGNFRARGRVFTYVESGLGKLGRFGGMYGGFGGLMGGPGVPDGQSMPPWHGWSGLRKKWVSLAILGQEDGSLPTLKVDKENWVALGVCMAVWGV